MGAECDKMYVMRGLELQYRMRSKIMNTREGKALTFGFTFGPVQFFIITNLPTEEDESPLVYIKINLKPDNTTWQVFREHSTESGR